MPGFLPGSAQYVPDLVLLVVVSWTLLLEARWSLPLAFAAGLLVDLLASTPEPIGVTALLFSIVALVVSFLGQDPFRSNVIRSVPVALGAAFLYRVLRLIAERLFSYNNFQSNIIFQVTLPVVIIDAALMLIVFVLVRFVSGIRVSRD